MTRPRPGPRPRRPTPPVQATPTPAGAHAGRPDPIREIAATLRLRDTGTIDHLLAEPSDSLTRTLPPANPSPAAATQTVPGYDLLEPLGEGGMGVVWKARQAKLNRLVALKMVLGEQRAGSKELIRFLAEAEAVAADQAPPRRPGLRVRRGRRPALPGHGVPARRQPDRPARSRLAGSTRRPRRSWWGRSPARSRRPTTRASSTAT